MIPIYTSNISSICIDTCGFLLYYGKNNEQCRCAKAMFYENRTKIQTCVTG